MKKKLRIVEILTGRSHATATKLNTITNFLKEIPS